MTTTAAPPEIRRPAPEPGRAPRDVGVWLVPLGLFTVTVAVHVMLARHMYTPIIHADEFGYLMGAHFMARGGGGTGSPYFPGYSVFLVPLWWLSRSGTTVYRWALDVNAVLAGATTLLSYLLARTVAPRAARWSWAAAALVVAAYPALVLYSNLAESENLLVPGFLAVALLVLRALEVPTTRRWAEAGAASGLLYAVHGRALAVAAAFAVTGVVALRPWRAHRPQVTAAAGSLLAGLGVAAVWIDWVTFGVAGRQLPTSDTRSPSLLSRVATVSGLRHLGVVLTGQGLYLMAAAGGLMALAGAWSWHRLRGRPVRRPERHGALFLVLVWLFVAVVSAVFLATGTRVDLPLYGRYIEVFSIPLLVIGAVTGITAGRRSEPQAIWRPAGWAVLATVGLWGAVVAYWGTTVRGTVVRTNAFGVADLFWGPNTAARLVLAVVLAVAVGGIAVVLVAFRVTAVVGVVVAVAVFVPATVRAYGDVVDQSASALFERVTPTALSALDQRFGTVSCASWDSAVTDAWQFYNTRLLLPDTVFPVFNSAASQPLPCSSGVVVSTRAFGARAAYPGARLMVAGNDPTATWVMPGTLQARLAAAGWLLPPAFPGALPVSAATGSIRLVPSGGHSAAVTVSQRGHRPVSVWLAHTGGGSPWLNATSIGPVSQYAVRIAAAWYQGSPGARKQVATARADLAFSLLPGQSEEVPVKIAPLALGSTDTAPRYLAPGTYDVELSLLQEGVRAWDATVQPVWLRVTVTP